MILQSNKPNKIRLLCRGNPEERKKEKNFVKNDRIMALFVNQGLTSRRRDDGGSDVGGGGGGEGRCTPLTSLTRRIQK